MENLTYLNEEWRDIKNYEGLYQVSNYGRIRSVDRFVYNYRSKNGKALIKGKILKQSLDNTNKEIGYYFVIFSDRKHYKVHRLVAFAFPEICGEWFEGAECNHKNEIKTDNRAINLEWVTHNYNIHYGTAIERKGNKLKGHIVSDETKRKIVKRRRENNSYKHTQETINRIKETRNRKIVLQFSKDGYFIKEYSSLVEAAYLNNYSFGNISSCCRGKTKTAYGYIWKFKEGA